MRNLDKQKNVTRYCGSKGVKLVVSDEQGSYSGNENDSLYERCLVMKCLLTPPCFFLSSSEWNQIDPSDREELNCKKEDGEFW